MLPELRELLGSGFNVLAYGPPGTGKTSLFHNLSRELRGEHALSYQCHEESSQAEIMIQYLPSPDGGVLTMQGVGAKGWVNGSIVVFDEINHLAMSPAISTFYKLMDDPSIAAFQMPDGTVIRPQKGFSVCATMNGDPSELPEAVRDRFHLSICMWCPSEEMISSLAPYLHEPTRQAYSDPNNAWPTFREYRNFGCACEVLGVVGSDVDEPKVASVAKMIWGPRWTEALKAIEANNRPEAEF
jgi:MoxR-like ATPase